MKYDYDVALITVTDTEFLVASHMYDNWQEFRFENDDQIYYITTFIKDGITRKVILAKQNEMGMTACAALSMKLVMLCHPRYLIMLGIAAGVALEEHEKQEYGDVVVADKVWNYSNGKFVSPEKADIHFGNVGFIPRPTVIDTDDSLKDIIKQAIDSSENECHVYVGPMASGSTVVANSEILKLQIRSQFMTTAALDMEAYAVAYVAKNATKPCPKAIIIKSVCDFADARKSDQYQKFAAYTSCEFGKFLYENFLPYEE